MQTEQEFDFGITLDNGDNIPPESGRQLNIPNKKPNPKQKPKPKQSPANPNANTHELSPQQMLGVSSGSYTLASATHPNICIATIFFKIAAFVTYFFLGYILSNVLTFIFTVILGALDFWVVKNISGRLLLGLRWWTGYDQKGNQIWQYETHGANFHANKVDSSFFWTSQIVGTLVWSLLLIINVLQLDAFWVLLIGINFGLYAINLYGFYQCRGEHKRKLSNLGDRIGRAGIMQIAGRFM